MARYLREGDFDGRYRGDRSALGLGVALACVNAGLDRAATERMFGSSSPLSNWLNTDYEGRLRSARDAKRQFDRVWTKAVAFNLENPVFRDRVDVLLEAQAVLNAAEADPRFKGVGGSTSLALLKAHAAIVFRTGKATYRASIRELAELAGVSSKTASLDNRRLRADGWLQQVLPASGAFPAWWSMSRRTNASVADSTSRTGGSDCYPYAPPGHDVWRWGGGLGKVSERYYATLGADAVSVRELAEVFQVTAQTVRRNLNRLYEHGLAIRRPDGGWVRGATELDLVASRLGISGKGVAQRTAHALQRNAFREWRSSRHVHGRRSREASSDALEAGAVGQSAHSSRTSEPLAPRPLHRAS